MTEVTITKFDNNYTFEVDATLPRMTRSEDHFSPAEYSNGHVEHVEYKGVDVTEWIYHFGIEQDILDELESDY